MPNWWENQYMSSSPSLFHDREENRKRNRETAPCLVFGKPEPISFPLVSNRSNYDRGLTSLQSPPRGKFVDNDDEFIARGGIYRPSNRELDTRKYSDQSRHPLRQPGTRPSGVVQTRSSRKKSGLSRILRLRARKESIFCISFCHTFGLIFYPSRFPFCKDIFSSFFLKNGRRYTQSSNYPRTFMDSSSC